MRTMDCFCAPVLCLLWLPELAAVPDLLSAPRNVRAVLGGSITVPCHYNCKYRDYTKYWCKGEPYELCSIVVKTPKNRLNERIFIADDKEKGMFNVTMTSLEEGDEDKYWCVIARPGRNVFAGVRLRISHTVTITSTTIPTTSAEKTQADLCWWEVLRWILFILMFCLVILTHIFAWSMTTSKTALPEPSQITRVYN